MLLPCASGVGTLRVALTDSPACGYDEVNVTIDKVRVHQSATANDTDAGWTDLSVTPARRVANVASWSNSEPRPQPCSSRIAARNASAESGIGTSSRRRSFGKPRNRLWRGLYFGYLRLVVPWFGRIFCGSWDAYAYILESLKHYPAQNGVAARMREQRLVNVRIVNLLGGIMSINYGEKPAGPKS